MNGRPQRSVVLRLMILWVAGQGSALKAVMHLVDEGLERLFEERSKPAGKARESTLLAALRVLVTALQTDAWLLQELRHFPSTGQSLVQSMLH